MIYYLPLRKNRQWGFTLIELLVAISVLGVIAAAGLTIINPLAQIQKANDARRKTDLAQIQRALEQAYQDTGAYPDSTGNIIEDKSWGSDWRYMKPLPADPKSSKTYVYVSTGQSYYLYASLDRGVSDAQACTGTGGACAGNGAADMQTACGGVCNYGVSSPNVSP